MTVGERIRYSRKSAKMTQKVLGDLLGVSAQMIAQYESGKRQPKIQQLQRIADALGVHVYELQDAMDIPEVRTSVFRSGIDYIILMIKEGIFLYDTQEKEELIKEIEDKVAEAAIKESNQNAFFDIEVKYSHKILNDMIYKYKNESIMDIATLTGYFLSLSERGQIKLSEYADDLYGNPIYRKVDD